MIDSFKVVSEDTIVSGAKLEAGDMYIAMQWLIHDKWDGETRNL